MSSSSQKIITRFPPSPTGALHIGNVRTAVFNYFFAKQNNGLFIVRVEDTDRIRSKKEHEINMLESLEWLGLYRDGELWHQSERGSVYKKYLDTLIKEGKAYISIESEGDNKEVVRFKNPNTTVSFTDLIRGEVTFDTTELGDFIIARNINDPVYHLAVVVDDHEVGVTHIIRGEDHVSNTPRHILIQEAIGAKRPAYAHLPLILAEDRSKLSKRKHGESVSLDYYKKKGYLPEALVNYMALLGWNPGTEKEIFSMDELIEMFDITKVQKGGAIFDEEKLRWINKEHIKLLPEHKKGSLIKEWFVNSSSVARKQWEFTDTDIEALAPLLEERVHVFSEINDLIEKGELDFYFSKPKYDVALLLWKKEKDLTTVARHLEQIRVLLQNIEEESSVETVRECLWEYAEKEGRGNVLWPLRVSLTGKEFSPDPFTIISLIGKNEALERIQSAINKILA